MLELDLRRELSGKALAAALVGALEYWDEKMERLTKLPGQEEDAEFRCPLTGREASKSIISVKHTNTHGR